MVGYVRCTYLVHDGLPGVLGDRLFRVGRRELRGCLLRYLHDHKVQRALLDYRPGKAWHNRLLEHAGVDAQGAPVGVAVVLCC